MMKSFGEIAAARHSVRGYSHESVSEDDLKYILECAVAAPSACNRQPWHIVVVRSEEGRQAVQRSYPGREWFITAPTYLVVCADDQAAWTRPCDGHSHADIDAAIITEHICLAAVDRGLGTCWVCNFDPVMLREKLHLSERPVAIIPLGFPAPGSVRASERRTLGEIISFR